MATANTGGSLIGKIGSYLQIVTKDPSSTAFVPLAEAYRQIGLLDDALEAARIGTKMLPHFSPGFSTMGRILGQMGRIDESMSAYAKALSIDRQCQSALVGLARLHLVRGERDLARKILTQAQEFHPDDEKISETLIALDLPRPWAEIKLVTQVQETAPNDDGLSAESAEPIATATLAEIYIKQGLLEKAYKVYQEILTRNSDNQDARQRMLQIKEQLSRQENLSSDKNSQEVEISDATSAEVETKVSAVTPDTAPVIENKAEVSSPLAVFQRWLTAIKHGRANV